MTEPFELPVGERGPPENVGVAGATEPWTVEILCAYIRAAQPRLVIETGSFSGETTFALAKAMAEAGGASMLFTVEADETRYRHVNELIVNTPFFGVGISAIHSDALDFLRAAPTSSADMIFLDDDHDAQHVRLEVFEAQRVIRHSGAIFVHDVMTLFNLDPIIREAGGICLDLRRLHPSGGLGILTK